MSSLSMWTCVSASVLMDGLHKCIKAKEEGRNKGSVGELKVHFGTMLLLRSMNKGILFFDKDRINGFKFKELLDGWISQVGGGWIDMCSN
jgi:hypothetical protein